VRSLLVSRYRSRASVGRRRPGGWPPCGSAARSATATLSWTCFRERRAPQAAELTEVVPGLSLPSLLPSTSSLRAAVLGWVTAPAVLRLASAGALRGQLGVPGRIEGPKRRYWAAGQRYVFVGESGESGDHVGEDLGVEASVDLGCAGQEQMLGEAPGE
jgi:hypothetical protein